MSLFRFLICNTLFCLLSLFSGFSPVFAVTGGHPVLSGEHPVLIVSSYNPDAGHTSGNIFSFIEEFERLGGKAPIVIENMNCKSFSESPMWKSRMKELLAKYQGDQLPSLIVLIGQEAWSAYLSQEASINVPVLVALASRNAIILPDDSVNLKTWMPDAVDFFNDFSGSSVKAGFIYEYNVEANIRLIKKLYPETKNIAFVSDNTYGGVSLQAYMREEMKKHPELELILLDGRTNTIYTISDELHELPPNTVLLMGTWRVDMNDGYFMRNATYTMMEAAADIPTFSISSVGIGYWAIGGVIPSYRALGKDMALQAVRLLQGPDSDRVEVEIIPNKVIMDSKVVKERHLDLSFIPVPIDMLNENPSFYEQYKYHIWILLTILIILLSGLFVSLYFYCHTKKLKDELEESEGALREAKERAEESNRLKSAFIANMSHEIRTPLNAIVGFSDVLTSEVNSEEEQQGYVDIIKTNSDLLLRLINDILDVSRLEANRVTFTFENCDIVQLCQCVLASVNQAYNSGNQFVFECDSESMDMRTDTQRLQQVIINLLSNADKFTNKGTITLRLEADKKNRVAIFSVSDTGCGIPLEKQKFVFERFEKLNEYVQGTGLGLSICKLIVGKWNGRIWVDPTYLNGTRFIFTHPLDIEQSKK